jgi:hypothetical protein
MVWLGVAWHLLALTFGALADQTPATPLALAAGLAVALLAVALIRRPPAAAPATPAPRTQGRPRHAPPPTVRAIDPDAPGRARPRAPSSASALA